VTRSRHIGTNPDASVESKYNRDLKLNTSNNSDDRAAMLSFFGRHLRVGVHLMLSLRRCCVVLLFALPAPCVIAQKAVLHKTAPQRGQAIPAGISQPSGIANPEVPRVINNYLPSPAEEGPKAWYEKATGIIAAAIGASIAATMSFYAFVLYPGRIKRLEMLLSHVEAQLKNLYGPLLGECIRADGVFRRMELSMLRLGADHRHYDFRELKVSHFRTKNINTQAPTAEDHKVLFARFLKQVYIPSNERRFDLLRHNLHLLGPYPPTSLFLFMTHASQLESLLQVKQKVDLSIPNHNHLDRYGDPYILTPFPTVMTAEVMAKVAFLKALQNEYRWRIGHSVFFPKAEIFHRRQYFLLLDKDLRGKLGKATDAEHLTRNQKKLAHYSPACPLVWGPYTAVELFELRSWLITKERPLRNFTGLEAEQLFIVAMLQADIAEISLEGTEVRPIHHRVAQAFDELDIPGSKKNFPWAEDFEWEMLEESSYQLMPFVKRGFTLTTLPDAPDFAYDRTRYSEMRETPIPGAKRGLRRLLRRRGQKKGLSSMPPAAQAAPAKDPA
jgi:hypothetical protein